MALTYLLKKELLQMRRSTFVMRLIVMFPIMIMCVLPWVMNQEVKNIVVDVVDNDHSSLSTQLTHRIEASDYFVLADQSANYAEALNRVERSQADIILEIPPHFERQLVRGEHPSLFIAANAVDGTKGSMGTAYLSHIISQHFSTNAFLNKLRTQPLVIKSETSSSTSASSSSISATSSSISAAASSIVSELYLYNKHLNYKVFMIPALMAILIMLICGFLPSLNIVSEKEVGTIEAINVTPVKKWEFILAKLIPYWAIGMLILTICFLVSWLMYGVTPVGSIGLIYLLAILLALSFSGLGLIISNYNETMQQAVFVMWFIVMLLLLLSGLLTPVRSMPHWAYLTIYVNPVHYFIDAIRTVFVRGGDFSCIRHQIFALTLFAIVMNVWAVMSYRKNA